MKLAIATRLANTLEKVSVAQCVGAMRSGSAYDVFGILCSLHGKDFNIKWNGSTYENYSILPPPQVLEWAGIKLEELLRLQEWNDVQKLSFKEMAAKLRKGIENAK